MTSIGSGCYLNMKPSHKHFLMNGLIIFTYKTVLVVQVNWAL